MVDHINSTRCVHVMTIEDPIEFLQRDNRSIINQREVAVDTQSFSLRAPQRAAPGPRRHPGRRDARLRDDRDRRWWRPRPGHLVFSTLHTLDATETINRIIAVFPPHQQKQIRLQLAAVLKAVISQRLIPRADGERPRRRRRGDDLDAVHPRLHRRQGEDPPHPGAIAAGTSQYGMQTFDQSIFMLYESGQVSYEEALHWATNVDEFKLRVQGIAMTSDAAREEMARAGMTGSADIQRFSK